MKVITIVRPYGTQIRRRVFDLLGRAGLVVRDAHVIPKGTSDADVLERLAEQRPDVLVIPFHAHRDADGNTVNGIDLAVRLIESRPSFADVPILMPVSTVAIAAARLKLSPLRAQPLDEALRANILLLDESDLDEPETVAAVAAHLGRTE